MISLRHKLTWGFGGLLLVTGALGVYGILLLTDLGSSIDVILRENYRSIIAMENVRLGMERMDRAALTALAGDEAAARRLRAATQPALEAAIRAELGNITLPGEQAAVTRLRDRYARYRAALAAAPDATRALAERRAYEAGTLRPLSEDVRRQANDILALNQAHMLQADETARAAAATARRRMGLLLLLGVTVAGALVYSLNRAILPPIRRLTRSAHEIRAGNLDLVLSAPSNDELGELAGAFNAMAAHLRTIRRSERARLVRVQQAMQVAIDHLPDAVAVLSPLGEVEMSNEAARRLFHLHPGAKPSPDEYVWLSLLLDAPAAADAFRKDRFDEAVQVFDDGEERFFLPQAIPVRDRDRLLAGVIYVFSDVTHLRRAYEARADLLAQVAHELNSPLTSLCMALHLVLEEKQGGLHPKQVELLLAARDDAERLHRISADLQGLAAQTSGDEAPLPDHPHDA